MPLQEGELSITYSFNLLATQTLKGQLALPIYCLSIITCCLHLMADHRILRTWQAVLSAASQHVAREALGMHHSPIITVLSEDPCGRCTGVIAACHGKAQAAYTTQRSMLGSVCSAVDKAHQVSQAHASQEDFYQLLCADSCWGALIGLLSDE